jgi:multiple sugar transport system substrate-binding protein
MARSLALLVTLLPLAVVSAGCQPSPPSGNDAAAAPQRISLQAFGDPAELSAYEELIAAFEVHAPHVKVEFIPVGNQREHMTKLATGFSGGNPPDLFLINFRRFGQFADKGVLEPLGPRLAERGTVKESDLFEQAVEAFRFNGTLMCIPQNISSLVVYYNRALFEKAGVPFPPNDWSWSDFVQAAKALTRDTDGDGRVDTYGLGFEPTLIRVAPFVWQAGGDIVDDLHQPKWFTLLEPGAMDALDFIRSWSATHKIVPPLAESKSENHESRFARGALGMILQSRRYTATLRTVSNLDWDVAPLPRHRHAATVLHADAYCLAKASPVKDAAYRFVDFALSRAGSTIIAKSGRSVPSLKAVAESPAFLDESARPRSARVFLDSIKTMRRTPNIATWNEIETRVDPLIEEWFFYPETLQESLGSELTALVPLLRQR